MIHLARRKGTLLEQNTYTLFKKAGFTVDMNVQLHSYEIDVYVTYNDKRIIVECKQYENAGLVVRNLIHQWADKNKELKADKVLLVVLGVDVSHSDFELAKSRGISIWDQDKFQHFFDRVHEEKENLLPEILHDLGLIAETVKPKSGRSKAQTKSELIEQYKKEWTLDYSAVLGVYESNEEMNYGRNQKIFAFVNDFTSDAIELFPDIIENKILTETERLPQNITYNATKHLPIIEAEMKEMRANNAGIHAHFEYDPINDETITSSVRVFWFHTLVFINIEIGDEEFELAKRCGARCIACTGLKPDVFENQNDLIILTKSDLIEHISKHDESVYNKFGVGTASKTVSESVFNKFGVGATSEPEKKTNNSWVPIVIVLFLIGMLVFGSSDEKTNTPSVQLSTHSN